MGAMARLLIPGVVAVVVTIATASAGAEMAPLKQWRQMRSANFFLVGDVGEGDLRRVAGRLEQFRAAVGVILPKASMTSATPTTVIVFRSHRNYEPFKPIADGKVLEHIAGYFLPGDAVNYITLTTETRGEVGDERFGIIYHELVHLMVNNTVRGVPVWFNEGLAEYYRTLEIAGNGKQVQVGGIHSPHVLLLREQFIPLEQLVAVDHGSPLYNEGSKASVFYAESWALVHYLLIGENQKYAKQVPALLDALITGAPFAEACQKALGVSSAQLQKELRSYVGGDRFSSMRFTFAEPLAAVERLTATPLADADAHATAGSLLVRMDRVEEGQAYLERAIALDPVNAAAHSTLGALYSRQGNAARARQHLQQAAAAGGASAQTYYDLADALIAITAGAASPDAADTAAIEQALRQAIALNPSFADAHARLARHLASRPGDGAEVFSLQQKAMALAPGREDYLLNFAYYLSNRQRFAEAKTVLSRLAAVASDTAIRENARSLLKRIDDFENQRPSDQIVERGPGGPRVIRLDLRRLQDGEQQVTGLLLAIECPRAGVRLVVEHEGKTSRVAVKAFDAVEFITYRTDQAGSISCGERPVDDDVIVTYRPGAGPETLGEAVAVEFLPKASAP
jgi:Tfp pilus assembly protein PilF